MPNEKPSSGRSPWVNRIAVALACVICFSIGLSIPLMIQQSSKDDELAKFNSILNLLEREWYYGSEDKNKDLIENAIIGMTTIEEDPHTNYFSIEQAEKFAQSLSGSTAGIGVTFYELTQGGIAISDVYIDSPAALAGLQPGDQIVRIDDLDLNELTSDKIVEYIKSSEGKELEFAVIRNGENQTIKITPAVFSSTVSVKQADDYGIITLTSFSETSGDDFQKAAKRLKDAGIDKIILDLRSNAGGYLYSAVDIASALLPENSVVMQEKLKDGTIEKLETNDKIKPIDFDEIVVLQNQDTASAAEVLIGALKDQMGDKVKTVGTTTYGKGTEQKSIPFADGTSLKYTIANWLTPDGTNINEIGFEPDIEVQDLDAKTAGIRTMKDGETIQPDTVHENAKAVQLYLQYLGYPADRADFYFSPASSQALILFQTDQGVEPTGLIDQPTIDLLLKAVKQKLNENAAMDDVQMAEAIGLIQGSAETE